MDERINYKRLITATNDDIKLTRYHSNNLGYLASFSDTIRDALGSTMYISEDEYDQLKNHNGRIRVAYWIESQSNE